jgi:hypothetical protein
MTQLAQKLDKKLATWQPEIAAQVEQIVTDVIELADTNTLDLLPSRAVVQEVLDALDERQARPRSGWPTSVWLPRPDRPSSSPVTTQKLPVHSSSMFR